MAKKKREKPEDFIGWKSEDGKLEVVGIADRTDKNGRKLFKVTCTECSKDPELFPEGHIVSQKCHLIKGAKPCGCGKNPRWESWQYLILSRRVGEKKGFIVHGFAEEFKNQNTKLNLECLKDGHKWTASANKVINAGTGCPKCYGNIKPTEQEALQRCMDICKDMDYDVIGFVSGYKGALKTRFEYTCKIHGKQNVSYHSFVNNGSRCKYCWKDKQKELGNGNGYYPERKDEVDFLYVLDFNGKFIKVGRSFDVDERIKSLRTASKVSKKKIHKLRIFTATHQEIYDYEQWLLQQLRDKDLTYYVHWSNECFVSESLYVLNKMLDICELEEVPI